METTLLLQIFDKNITQFNTWNSIYVLCFYFRIYIIKLHLVLLFMFLYCEIKLFHLILLQTVFRIMNFHSCFSFLSSRRLFISIEILFSFNMIFAEGFFKHMMMSMSFPFIDSLVLSTLISRFFSCL